MNLPEKQQLEKIYGENSPSRESALSEKRFEALADRFRQIYRSEEAEFFTSPGRTEIIGNHTDHNGGKVLAASISMDTIGAACPNGTDLVRITSQGYPTEIVIPLSQRGKSDCRIWCEPEKKLFDINIDSKEYKEVSIEYDYDDLMKHEPGYMEESEWMQYCLNENAFNSLKDLLDGDITGNQFDKARQLKAFAKINANTDGTCGRNVYEFVKGKLQ